MCACLCVCVVWTWHRLVGRDTLVRGGAPEKGALSFLVFSN
jgi:hypothetical protein